MGFLSEKACCMSEAPSFSWPVLSLTNALVPLAVEIIADTSDGGEFCGSAQHARFVLGRIDFSARCHALVDRGCRDPVDDDAVAPLKG